MALLVLSSLLAGVTYGTYRTATFEEETRVTVDEVLAAHDGLERLSITITYEETFPFFRPDRVTVTVGHPPGSETPALAATLADRIDGISDTPLGEDTPVDVEVRYVAVDRATAYREGRSGSQSTVSTARSRTASTFSPSVTLM